MLLFSWGVFKEFQKNTLSPKITSQPSINRKTIPTVKPENTIPKTSQPSTNRKTIPTVKPENTIPKTSQPSTNRRTTPTVKPENTIPKTSQPSINRRTTPTVKPENTIEDRYYQPRAVSYNFPLKSCGDKDPGGYNTWYPVYVNNTARNLNQVKTNYCRDALVKYRGKAGITSIQVASFLNPGKAQEFANLMKNAIGSGEVGKPYYFGNKSVTNYYKKPQYFTYNFPLKSCGDKNPGGYNTWYPVYVSNNARNLNQVKTNYCRDALVKYRDKAGITSIQVASFLNPGKAQEFANLMKNAIGSGEVGKPYYFGNKSVTSYYKKYSSSQRPSPTRFVTSYYQNLSYGNYKTTWNQLSSNFKRQTGGYSEYVNWWNSVRKINIQQIRLIERNNDQALVYVDLTYITNTGKYYNDPKKRISLIWNNQLNTWQFDGKF